MVLRPLHPRGRRGHRRLDPREPGRGRRDGRAGHGDGEEAGARRRRRASARPRPIRIGRIKAPEFRTGSIPLEFSVSAGVATLAPRDLNDGTRGYADWFGARPAFRSPGPPTSCTSRAWSASSCPTGSPPGWRSASAPTSFAAPTGTASTSRTRSLSETVSTRPSAPGRPDQDHGPLLSRRGLLRPRRPRALLRQGRLPLPPRGGRRLGAVEGFGDGERARRRSRVRRRVGHRAEDGLLRRGGPPAWPASAA